MVFASIESVELNLRRTTAIDSTLSCWVCLIDSWKVLWCQKMRILWALSEKRLEASYIGGANKQGQPLGKPINSKRTRIIECFIVSGRAIVDQRLLIESPGLELQQEQSQTRISAITILYFQAAYSYQIGFENRSPQCFMLSIRNVTPCRRHILK